MDLLECSLHDCLTLVGLRQALMSERAESKSRMAKVCRLKKQVHAAEGGSEALGLMRACFDDLEAELASLTARIDQENAEHDPLAARIREMRIL